MSHITTTGTPECQNIVSKRLKLCGPPSSHNMECREPESTDVDHAYQHLSSVGSYTAPKREVMNSHKKYN